MGVLAHAFFVDLHTDTRFLGQRDEALEIWGAAVDVGKDLLELSPQDPHLMSELATAENDLSQVYFQLGDFERSIGLLESAIKHQRAALLLDPERQERRTYLRNHYYGLASSTCRTGDHVRTLEAGCALAQVFGNRPQDYLEAAEFVAYAGRLAQKDQSLSEAERTTLSNSNFERAVELLVGAVELGFDNLQLLEENQSYYHLRELDSFRELCAELR